MISIAIGSKSHKNTFFKLLLDSQLTSARIRFRSPGAGKKSRFSTTTKQTNDSSLVLATSRLAGRHSNLIGRLYEKHSLKCMSEILLFKDLVHVGKRSSQDGGIDIKGWLYLDRESKIKNQDYNGSRGQLGPDEANDEKQERFIKAIAQCKCSRAELRLVRELEGLVGTSSTHKNSSSSKPTVGILFSSRGFTTASLTQAAKSPFPIILVTLDFPSALSSISEDTHPGDILGEDDVSLHPPCRISHCYPNPIAVQLIRPFELVRVFKLTTDSLPAQHSWVLVKRKTG